MKRSVTVLQTGSCLQSNTFEAETLHLNRLESNGYIQYNGSFEGGLHSTHHNTFTVPYYIFIFVTLVRKSLYEFQVRVLYLYDRRYVGQYSSHDCTALRIIDDLTAARLSYLKQLEENKTFGVEQASSMNVYSLLTPSYHRQRSLVF